MQTFFDILFIITGYFMGSVPFGLLVAKYAEIGDVRQQGSGNIGATNLLRIGGKKLGAITLILDALKGLIPVILAKDFGSELVPSFTALAAVLGHIFPIWLKFKGGKGVATTLAVYAGLSFPLFLFAGASWLAVFYITRISSLSSIAAMIFIPIITIFFMPNHIIFISFILSAIVIYRHKSNIIRLMRGQEDTIIKKNENAIY